MALYPNIARMAVKVENGFRDEAMESNRLASSEYEITHFGNLDSETKVSSCSLPQLYGTLPKLPEDGDPRLDRDRHVSA